MQTPPDGPRAIAAQARPPLWVRVSEAVWERRWKLGGLVAIAAVGQLCRVLPDEWQAGCELLAKVGTVVIKALLSLGGS